MAEETNLTILIAPLDWGLGHATRCIPIIRHLLKTGCKVIIATEGIQEKLLKAEFPLLHFVHLPGYRIKYTTSKRFFSAKILMQISKILSGIKREQKWLNNFIQHNAIDAIISDNRYGFYNSRVPSVFITHQLLIKTPLKAAEKILQGINYRFINKFSACWVPDHAGETNLAGFLSHPASLPNIPVRYIGGLSRLKFVEGMEKKYDLLIIISGPEPQRALLEEKMLEEVKNFAGKVLLIRGLPGNEIALKSSDRLTIQNHLTAEELSEAFNASELIISRSGYTTVMDICKLKKKSVLIPTPGQTEQEYLAEHLLKQGWCLTATQENFSLTEIIEKAKGFGFTTPDLDMNFYTTTLNEFVNKLTGLKGGLHLQTQFQEFEQ